MADAFLASRHAVRLAPAVAADWCDSPRLSTLEHRALEDQVLGRLDQLADRDDAGVAAEMVEACLGRERSVGDDQAEAVRALCPPGPAVRALIAPAGHVMTTTVRPAADAHLAAERDVERGRQGLRTWDGSKPL